MKHNVSVTIDSRLFREIEELRGREKRSTFIEHLLKEGVKEYLKKERATVNRAIAAPYP